VLLQAHTHLQLTAAEYVFLDERKSGVTTIMLFTSKGNRDSMVMMGKDINKEYDTNG
jgi:hypothetical protein